MIDQNLRSKDSPTETDRDPLIDLLGDLVGAIQRMGRQQIRLAAAIETVSATVPDPQRETGQAPATTSALLDIIDYVDDAIAVARQREDPAWIERLERLAAHVLRTFQRAGISEIVTARTQVDPDAHEVVDSAQDASLPAGAIKDVIRRGFISDGQVLRRAQVIAVRS